MSDWASEMLKLGRRGRLSNHQKFFKRDLELQESVCVVCVGRSGCGGRMWEQNDGPWFDSNVQL